MSYSSAEDVIPYLVTGNNKNYPYPQGLREFSTGYFDVDGNVTTMSSVLIPGTYDLVILIDGDVSGFISQNSKDYFFFVEAKTVSGGDLDISAEFEGISILE
ncbi:MAG: hypothetical protein JEY99_21335 [Spirochaetales bacterium]|nr:hypothetical protein [Spirochaetales bacterium]